MILQTTHDFEEVGAEKSSVFGVAGAKIQFLWHQNLLEECEGFAFKQQSLAANEIDSATEIIKNLIEKGTSVAQLFEALITSPSVGLALNFSAKFALDQHFNYEVQAFKSNLICRCFGLSKEMLREDLNKGQTCRIEDWQDRYMLGMGCGTCIALAEDFFRREFDLPEKPSEKFCEIRRQKVIYETHLITPLGKTPIELIEFIQANCPNKSMEIQRVSGYQVYVVGVNDSELKGIQQYYREQHHVDFEFILN
jgi:bacterioferritin-associated ferredoxin